MRGAHEVGTNALAEAAAERDLWWWVVGDWGHAALVLDAADEPLVAEVARSCLDPQVWASRVPYEQMKPVVRSMDTAIASDAAIGALLFRAGDRCALQLFAAPDRIDGLFRAAVAGARVSDGYMTGMLTPYVRPVELASPLLWTAVQRSKGDLSRVVEMLDAWDATAGAYVERATLDVLRVGELLASLRGFPPAVLYARDQRENDALLAWAAQSVGRVAVPDVLIQRAIAAVRAVLASSPLPQRLFHAASTRAAWRAAVEDTLARLEAAATAP